MNSLMLFYYFSDDSYSDVHTMTGGPSQLYLVPRGIRVLDLPAVPPLKVFNLRSNLTLSIFGQVKHSNW